jgi:ribonuclease P protein component
VTSLRREVDFRRVLEQGVRVSDHLLAVRALRREGSEACGTARIGISVGRRFGKAVQRNQIRRRLRESARAALGCQEGAWDLVFLPRAAARAITYEQLRQSVRHLLRRAGVCGADD